MCSTIGLEDGGWSGTWDRGEGRGRSSCVCEFRQVHTSMRACTHARARTHARTRTHAHARTRTHTHLLIFLIPVNNEVH